MYLKNIYKRKVDVKRSRMKEYDGCTSVQNYIKNDANSKPPPNKGPPWTIGRALFWALGGGFLFGHWSTIFCLFPPIPLQKGGGLLF